MVNRLLLEFTIKSKGYTIAAFCKVCGIGRTAFYKKTRGISCFTLEEVYRIMELLDIEDPRPIFFAKEV